MATSKNAQKKLNSLTVIAYAIVIVLIIMGYRFLGTAMDFAGYRTNCTERK